MNEWQPIDTAPKNGESIILYSKEFIDLDYNESGVVDGFFDYQDGWTIAVWNGCHDVYDSKTHVEPTYWMEKRGPNDD